MTLTRKTKPLGPRQRAAYVKPYRAALEAAKAELAAAAAAREEATRTRERLSKRLYVPAVVSDAKGGNIRLVNTSEIQVYGLNLGPKSTAKERRAAKAALTEGKFAVTIAGGSPKLPAFSKRFRKMTPRHLAQLRSLDRRLTQLRQAREDLITAAFAGGLTATPDELADVIVAMGVMPRPGYVDEWGVKRAESALAEAEKHDGTATCPCGRCTGLRQRAAQEKEWADRQRAREKAEAKRLAKLRKMTFTCPNCEQVNEDASVDEDDDSGREYVVCEACDKAIDVDELPQDEAKAA